MFNTLLVFRKKTGQFLILLMLGTFGCFYAISNAYAKEAYPQKAVRIIVPYQAGQGTDIVARYVAEHLSQEFNQSFIIENIGGAGGNIGVQNAARADNNGYTLIMGTNATHVLNQYLYRSIQINPVESFEPIGLVGTLPMVIVSSKASNIRNVDDIISNSGSVDAGLSSTTARLVLELFNKETRADVFAIPYKGSGQSLSDLIGGEVELAIDTITATKSQIDAERLYAVAVTSLNETPLLPGVKSVAEQGVDNFEVVAWNALYAPKGTPPEIIEKLNNSLQKLLEKPETQKRLSSLGMDAASGSPEDLADFAEKERKKWKPIIEDAGLAQN